MLQKSTGGVAGWKSGRRRGGSTELLHGKSRAQRGRGRRLQARRSLWPLGGAPAAACRGWSATEGLGYGGAGPCSGAELAGRLRLESGGCGRGEDEAQGSAGPNKGGTGDFGVRVWERPRRDPRRGSRVVCASAGERRKGTGPPSGPGLAETAGSGHARGRGSAGGEGAGPGERDAGPSERGAERGRGRTGRLG